jgi:hypothetical protein
MAFVITYHDPQHANSGGTSVAGNEREARETIMRLKREGFEVTRVEPPLPKHSLFPRPPPR